jgi:glycosyltransferase involved in cell wall biosynthesis
MRSGGDVVSVIIPVYNGERFLAEAIDSVFAQDYRPIEVIVVDDGSDDRSAEIARSYDDVMVLSQVNSGLAAARNAGIAVASGAFIAFLDADDVMLPSNLRIQVDYIHDHPEVGCTLGAWENFGAPADDEWQVDPPPRPDGAVDVASQEALVHLRGGGIGIALVVRRTALDVVGHFDTSFDFAEDLDWLFRLRESGVRAVILPDIVGHRRLHASNMTKDRSAAVAGWLRFLKAAAGRRHEKDPADDH